MKYSNLYLILQIAGLAIPIFVFILTPMWTQYVQRAGYEVAGQKIKNFILFIFGVVYFSWYVWKQVSILSCIDVSKFPYKEIEALCAIVLLSWFIPWFICFFYAMIKMSKRIEKLESTCERQLKILEKFIDYEVATSDKSDK